MNNIYKPFAEILAEEVSDKELRVVLEENLENILENFNSKKIPEPIFGDLKELNVHFEEYVTKFNVDPRVKRFLNYGNYQVSIIKGVRPHEVTVKDIISTKKEEMMQFRNIGPTIIEYAQNFFEETYNLTFE